MEPSINEAEGSLAPLKKVTPLSKYLAMALFVILPFIGGWIGYNYAPEKVVEVDKIIEVEILEKQKGVRLSEGEDVQQQSPNFVFNNGDKYVLEEIKEFENIGDASFAAFYQSDKYKLQINQNPAGKGLGPFDKIKSRTIETINGESTEIEIGYFDDEKRLYFVSFFGKGYFIHLDCINLDCSLSEMTEEFDWVIDNLKLE